MRPASGSIRPTAMQSKLTSSLERDSYHSASPRSLESLMVRKAVGKQPTRVPYSHIQNASSDSEDSQDFTSTSSGPSSVPMDSYFPPTLGASTSAAGNMHPHSPRNNDTSTILDPHSHPNGGPSRTETSSTPATPTEDLDVYSVTGLPILDQSIPTDELPDDLIVHDAHDLPYPVRYVRVTPLAKGPRLYAVPVRDPSSDPQSGPPRRVAQLHLANDNHVAADSDSGHGHSAVFRAPLTLPVAAGSEVATRVRVVAKTPAPVCGSHRQLHQEARMYHAFPKELFEGSARQRCDASPERRGDERQRAAHGDPGPDGSEGGQKRRLSFREQLNKFRRKHRKSDLEDKVVVEVPAGSDQAVFSRDDDETPHPPLKSADAPPIVPKFFGYYLLLKPDGKVFFELSEGHGECGEEGMCGVAWPPAILLIEDCGDPIQPWLFSGAHRWECYRLLDGLHGAGFVAGRLALSATAWTEKMLVQPGPLAAPREARSYATPSFRLVDFGRAQCRQVGLEEHWKEWCDHDSGGAFDALQLDRRAR